MKRYLFISVLLIRTAYGQPGNGPLIDTICVKIPTYQGLVIAAEQKKVLEQQIGILNERISGCQSSMALLIAKDSLTVSTFQRQVVIYDQEKKLLLDQIGALNKIIRKYKRRQFFTAAGGIIATGAMIYLYSTK